MNLATFGAILSYAMELEQASETFYRSASERTNESLFEELAAQGHQRRRRIERLRREGVAEMILEPIVGLNRDEFGFPAGSTEAQTDPFEQALLAEDTRQRFFHAAAEKLPIREVARDLLRLATENGMNKDRLEERRPRS